MVTLNSQRGSLGSGALKTTLDALILTNFLLYYFFLCFVSLDFFSPKEIKNPIIE